MMIPSSMSTPVPQNRATILCVDLPEALSRFAPHLNDTYRVSTASESRTAIESLRRVQPALVVTEMSLVDGTGIEVCEAAKALVTPPSVLVTTSEPERAPDALVAGCDGILLKPFQPNLLLTRLSRLLRERSVRLKLQAARTMGKSLHLSERIDLLKKGTNQVWPNTHCPYCSNPGVTSFDYASLRRAWYACLACRRVWMAKRQE